MLPFTDFPQAETGLGPQMFAAHRKMILITDVEKKDKMSSLHQLLQNRASCCKVSQAQPQPAALVTEPNHHCPHLDHPSHQIRVYQTAGVEGSLLVGQERCLHTHLGTSGAGNCSLTDRLCLGSNKFKTLKLKQRKEFYFWESCTRWCQAHDLHSGAEGNTHFLHWYWNKNLSQQSTFMPSP